MRITKSLSATGDSAPVALDHYQSPFAVGLGVQIVGTSATYSVLYTFDNPQDFASQAAFLSGAVWYTHPTLGSQTTNQAGNLAFPVTAVKLSVSAIVAATVTLTVMQAGPAQ